MTAPDEIRKELIMRNIPQRMIKAGDIFTLPGPVVITVLSPVQSTQVLLDTDETSVNERSLVFRLCYRNFSMIFCADTGNEAEQSLVAGRNQLESTVLKVGHHGSRFSTSEVFLKRVSPKLALISAGAGNRFGLPSLRTVNLLKTSGIPQYRTDIEGSIEVATDGVTWTVLTPYKPE
jgi:competence protein ComEC